MGILKFLQNLDISMLWQELSSAIPADYWTAFFAILILRVMDTITARVAVQRERRKYLFENPACKEDDKEVPKWLSHTFTEKLFIKCGMYTGILTMGGMALRLGFSSWGMTFAIIACLYAELTSIYENTVRAGMAWPSSFKAGIQAIGSLLKSLIEKFKSGEK